MLSFGLQTFQQPIANKLLDLRRDLRVGDLLVTAAKDLLDVLAWQLLWVGGLFCGQRLYEKKRALPLQKPLPVILILLSIGFFAWRLTTISVNAVPTNQAWIFDKWHLGPLRLLNLLVTGWVISNLLGNLQRDSFSDRAMPTVTSGLAMPPVRVCGCRLG
jgi:OpgC protein